MAKVWSKRFDNTLNPFIEKFNASIGFDRKLILEDLDCSIAHAKMLGKTQVLSNSETGISNTTPVSGHIGKNGEYVFCLSLPRVGIIMFIIPS